MFNTVAKYLWGNSTDSGHNQTAGNNNSEKQHDKEENLEIHQEEDWLVVETADKENNGHLASHAQYTLHSCQHHVQTNYSQPILHGAHDNLSQNSLTASEAELLDDASALAHNICENDNCLPTADIDPVSDSNICPLHDFGWAEDVDKYSDTDSLPESVFSACSGQSHATYHPCGSHSEPWVVAPPPCFTGSQVENMLPLASSPLENLLIEHPSMSVYHSFPSSHPILSSGLNAVTDPPTVGSCHKPNATHCIDEAANKGLKEKNNNRESSHHQPAGDPILNRVVRTETSLNALQQRNTHIYAAIHPAELLLPHRMFKNACLAQRVQCMEANKLINRNKCDCQNKVREHQGHTKGNNRRNKRMHPSGFKSSRFTQHM